MNTIRDPLLHEVQVYRAAVNVDALREALENEFKGLFKGLAVRSEGVTVYMAENATESDLTAVWEYVTEHDPSRLTTEQVDSLAAMQKQHIVRRELSKFPDDLEKQHDWLMAVVPLLVKHLGVPGVLPPEGSDQEAE